MSDLDALLAPSQFIGRRCTIAQALDLVTAEERKALVAALDNPLVRASGIASWLTIKFPTNPFQAQTVLRHRWRHTDRADRCACP